MQTTNLKQAECLLVYALLVCCARVAQANLETKTLVVGYLVPMDGGWDIGPSMASAVSVAIDAVNDNPLLSDGYHFAFTWRNSACSPGQALKGMTSLLADEKVDFLVGPACSVACEPTQLLASTIDLAQEHLLPCIIKAPLIMGPFCRFHIHVLLKSFQTKTRIPRLFALLALTRP